MKKMTATFLTMVFCGGVALSQAQTKTTDAKAPPAGNSAASDELKQIENDWVAAVKAKDAVKLGEILADSWVGLGWDGKTTDKAKDLAEMKINGNSLDSIEMGPMKVRMFGNTAVVTGSDTEKSMANGKDTSGKYVWTDVFVKQNGKWRAVASQ